MRALVTGSTGFVGRHLVAHLLDNHIEVACLLRPGSDIRGLKDFPVELIRADYLDTRALGKIPGRFDLVFHVAGVINARRWDTYYQANCLYTQNLLRMLVDTGQALKKLVFISSISAAGPSERGEYRDETAHPQPVSNYGRSKLLAEKMVMDHSQRFPSVILRPPNVLGPLQHELYQAIQLVRRGIFPLIGNGEIQTSICYVEDLVRICRTVALDSRAAGEIYYVTHPRAHAWVDITRQLRSQLGKRGPMIKIPHWVQYGVALGSEFFAGLTGKSPMVTRENLRMSRRYYWLYSGDKLRRELGLVPGTGLEKAISKTLDFYRREGKVP